MTNHPYIKDGTPEPALRGGYGIFADIEQRMCRRHPRFCTVLLLGITPRGFGTHGNTPSGKISGASGNLKNHKFSTFEQKFLSFWASNPSNYEVFRLPRPLENFLVGV